MKHTNTDNECFQNRINELVELCDHEYYMSALPLIATKKRIINGKDHLSQTIEEFRNIQKKVKCLACTTEINKQISVQEQGLKEIGQTESL